MSDDTITTIEQDAELLDIIEEAAPHPKRGNGHDTVSAGFALSDTGNAELFTFLFGDRLRFDHRRGRRLIFTSHRWQEDKSGEWTRLAIEAARVRYMGAVDAPEDQRKRISRHALQSESRNALAATLKIAEALPPIADDGAGWDSGLYLLGGPNGVIELRTGVLRDGRPEDRITMSAGTPVDLGAGCPRWLQFLREIFRDDLALIDFIWRAVGYSITGITLEQVIFICYGTGANGKTVFLNVLRRVLGDYAYNTPFSTFEMHSRASIPSDLAALEGKRLVTASETGEASRLNEQRVKALSGGDPITARAMYSDFFTYTPTAKIWLLVNHRPRVNDDSHGFWRRVRLIPFTRQFTTDADRNLEEKLMAEAPGILTWAILGALEWQARGLDPPGAVVDAVADYQRESDPLGDFLEERCIESNLMATLASELYGAYSEWAKEMRIRDRDTMSLTAFGKRMGTRFAKGRRGNKAEYRGVGLRHA